MPKLNSVLPSGETASAKIFLPRREEKKLTVAQRFVIFDNAQIACPHRLVA